MVKIEMKEINCNLCGANDYKILLTKNPYQIVECNNCSLVYVNPQPTTKELKQLYSFKKKYHKELLNKKIENQLRRGFETKLKLIEKYKKSGKILDVGCSAGVFLDMMKGKGWECYGVELSKDTANYAKGKYGLNVKINELEKIKFPQNYFDIVCLWDILEHVQNPLRSLVEVNRILKTEGVMFINTPNVDGLFPKLSYSILAKIFGAWPNAELPHHLYYFSSKTLTQMLMKAGFNVISKDFNQISTNYIIRSNVSKIIRSNVMYDKNIIFYVPYLVLLLMLSFVTKLFTTISKIKKDSMLLVANKIK